MRSLELLTALDRMDNEQKAWLFSFDALEIMFPEETKPSLVKSLTRHSQKGLIQPVCKGLYANPRAKK